VGGLRASPIFYQFSTRAKKKIEKDCKGRGGEKGGQRQGELIGEALKAPTTVRRAEGREGRDYRGGGVIISDKPGQRAHRRENRDDLEGEGNEVCGRRREFEIQLLTKK